MSTEYLSAEQIRKLVVANPRRAFGSLDLLTGKGEVGLDWAGLDPEADRSLVRAYQRLTNLHPNLGVAEHLVRNGIVSANQVARIPRAVFVADHAGRLGLDTSEAESLHTRATGIRNKTMHLWASVRGTVASPFFRNTALDTVSVQAKQTFESLPSYQELFGTLDYCGCEECHSIFGPAAYLVDLLRIIDEHVTKPNVATIDAEFLFGSRRPDIGSIDLTCANTTGLVAYLQIVNERLLAFAQQTLGVTDAGTVLEQMASTLVYPRQLPFNTPLDQVIVLLDKVGVSYGSILSAWKAQPSTVAARSLGLSPEQQAIITTPLTTAQAVAPYYNVSPEQIPTDKVPPVQVTLLSDANFFLAKTWSTFADLMSLVDQDLSQSEQKDGLQANFFINQGLGGKWVALEKLPDGDTYRLTNLNVVVLDRISRLLRLADALGQPPKEVDWALRCVKAGGAPLIDNNALISLSQLMNVGTNLSLGFTDATVLLGPIKTYGEGDDGAGVPFDQLFNPPSVTARQGSYHPLGNSLNAGYQDPPLPWSPGSTKDADVSAITRVLPGLGLGLPDINALGSQLYGAKAQHLTVPVLSVLYRHAQLSRALQLPMPRYLTFLQLMGLKDPTAPTTAELMELVAASQWMSRVGVSVYTMDYVINGNPSVYVNPLYQPSTVSEWLCGLRTHVSEASPTLQRDIAAETGVLFGVASTLVEVLLPLAVGAVTLPPAAGTWERAFLKPTADGKSAQYEAYVEQVLEWLSRWLVLSQALNLPEATLASVAAHPAAYELPANFGAISWTAIENMELIQTMMEDHGDLQLSLLSYIDLASTAKPLTDPLAALQKATGWDPADVQELLAGPVKSEPGIVGQLADLKTCFRLMGDLGSNSSLMATITALGDTPAASWSQYTGTAALVMAATASRYGQQWSAIWAVLSGDLAAHERDALLALVMSQLNARHTEVKTPRNVYEFLLTDVEMGPTTQISYVLEALNAAQLYLQRCRLRLEPGVEDLSQIQDPWWDWMMNYRIWQANREIFVYPENYLVPNLRKSATSQFATLSQALQQSDVNKAYVGSAFRTYIDGFSEIAQLKPVDAYRTRIHDSATLYLLARTKTGPYTFYYCSQADGMTWTPWQKIDLSINSPTCTAVYAFNRLFLFWNEIKQNDTSAVSGTAGAVNTTHGTSCAASVMYSFMNQQGKWVQPQTLVEQDIILFKSNDDRNIVLKDDPVFNGLFDMDDPVWQKVFAFSVTAGNYASQPGNVTESERLVVMYGPSVANTATTVDPGTTSPSNDPSASAFWNNLHDRAQDHNRMVQGQLSGNLSLRPVSVLNLSLEADVLVQRQEILLFDPYQAQPPTSSLRAELQSSGTVMQISQSAQPIADNHSAAGAVGLTAGSGPTPVDGTSFIGVGVSPSQSVAIFNALETAGVLDAHGMVQAGPMATLDLYAALQGIVGFNAFGPAQFAWVQKELLDHMGATELFSSVGGLHTSVAPVGGQPGWFLFFAGSEVFLLTPRPLTEGKTVFSTFAEALVIGDPLVTPLSAVMSYQGLVPGSIGAAAAAAIYQALTQFSLITNGRLAATATANNVGLALGNLVLQNKITQEQVPYVYNALANAPILFNDAFIDNGIDDATSATIWSNLQKFSIVDPNGRVDESVVTGTNVALALSNLLFNNTITRSQIAGIYSTLAHAPRVVDVTYVNQGDGAGRTATSTFIFDVTRLSTGAVKKVSSALFAGGVDLLLDPRTQQIPVVPVLPFDRFSPSATNLNWPSALDATQVDFDGLYGQYYWEIFYHIPMLVAYALNTNQQFSDAQAWLQYIFNPTVAEQFVTAAVIGADTAQAISPQQAAGIIGQLQSHNIGTTSAPILSKTGEVNASFAATTDLGFLKVADPSLNDVHVLMTRNILLNYQLHAPSSHYWRFRPFRNRTLEGLQDSLADSSPAVKVYNDDPFDPFAIAGLRWGAFEKSTLMQYVDNLIAWGDQLFTQDSWESITAAYMLYVYTYDLLGPKPQQVGECPGAGLTLTFDKIKAKYGDGIPQFLIDLEHFIPSTGTGADTPMTGHAFNDLYVYFCVPENSALIGRWDTVQDRMYKINNSMNIAGVVRTLPLFQPPLNPLDLVRAAAAGNNVQATAAAGQQLSAFRYASAIGTAQSLCGTVIELGNSLLSALEKNDAERLSGLRTHQEGQVLNLITQIKQQRITELQATIQSLTAAKTGAAKRLDFYTTVVDRSDYEKTSLEATEAALAFNILGSISKTAATIAYTIPQVGSPFAMTYGGIQVGSALSAAASVFEIGSEISNYVAQRAATMGAYERRSNDWGLQKKIAQADQDTLEQQIIAATAQLQSAQQDLAVHSVSIAQNEAIEAYLGSKFTNQDLYLWMAGRLSAVYRQTYALAMQSAREAETAYQYELDSSQSFLVFDYWDSLRKGLTAGEGLRLALNRLDAAYRAGDTRRLEVERTISLAMIAPDQLLTLKTTGSCAFPLTEALFDYDYPGQYARKIRTVSVSIPAAVGPYQNVKAILTQTKSSVLTAPDPEGAKYLLAPTGDPPPTVRVNWAPNQSVAISRGVDDSGLFMLDFHDPRYLPFENTGAVSEWTLDMPLQTNRFDFAQLSDVIITVRYTALFDGDLATSVKTALGQAPLKGGLYLNASMQNAAWQAFLSNHSDTTKQTLTLNVDPAQIGFFESLTYTTVVLKLDVADGITVPPKSTFLTFTAGAEPAQTPTFNGGQALISGLTWNGKSLPPAWSFTFALGDQNLKPLLSDGFIDGKKLLNMQVIVLYQAKIFWGKKI